VPMGWERFCTSPALLGWSVSLLFHGAVMLVFLFFSPTGSTLIAPLRRNPVSSIQDTLRSLPSEPMITDLQVEPLPPGRLLPDEPEAINVAAPIPMPQPNYDSLIVFDDVTAGVNLPAGGEAVSDLYQSRFCDTEGESAHVCYVVDCSGSMVIAYDYVRRELKSAIGNLTPAQYFHVIFYAGGDPIELMPARLIRANVQNRQKAYDFMDGIQLATVSSTEAAARSLVEALGCALAVTSAAGEAAGLIYLLTDGEYDHEPVRRSIEVLQAQRAYPARINVIACGNRGNEDFLRGLAYTYKGQYRFVSDEELAAQPR